MVRVSYLSWALLIGLFILSAPSAQAAPACSTGCYPPGPGVWCPGEPQFDQAVAVCSGDQCPGRWFGRCDCIDIGNICQGGEGAIEVYGDCSCVCLAPNVVCNGGNDCGKPVGATCTSNGQCCGSSICNATGTCSYCGNAVVDSTQWPPCVRIAGRLRSEYAAERPNGEIRMLDRPLPDQRRPLLILSPPVLIPLLHTVMVAAVTSTLRGTPTSNAPAASTSCNLLSVRGPPHRRPLDITSRLPSLIPRDCRMPSDAPCLRECEARPYTVRRTCAPCRTHARASGGRCGGRGRGGWADVYFINRERQV